MTDELSQTCWECRRDPCKCEQAAKPSDQQGASPPGVQAAQVSDAWVGVVECCDAKGMWLVMADDCPLVPGQKVAIRIAGSAAHGGEVSDG